MRLESLASTSALVILSFSLGGCSLASLLGSVAPAAITQDSVPGVLGNEKAATASAINSKAIKAMVASGQVASSAKLVWYNAQGQAVGPVMIDANGRVIPAALDTNGSNDAGVALNPEGIVPAVLASAAPGANRAAVAQAATTESHTLVGLSQHVQISASAYHWFDRVGGTDLGPVQYDGNGEIITTGHEGQIYNPSGFVVASESGPTTLAGTYAQDSETGAVTGVRRVWSNGTYDNGDAVSSLSNLANEGYGYFSDGEHGSITVSDQSNSDFISGMMVSGMDNPHGGTIEMGLYNAAINPTSSATLSAKHKARYTGAAEVVELTTTPEGEFLGMDNYVGRSNVDADFDNGTVAANVAYDYHPHSNPTATNTSTIAMNNGRIVGTSFVGDTHYSLDQSNIAITSQHGQMVGTFAGAEGNTAGGSFLGQLAGSVTRADGTVLDIQTLYGGTFVAGQVCQNLACN